MSRKLKKNLTIEVVKGHGMGEGLYINDNRLAGTKPMPGGRVIHSWCVSVEALKKILRERGSEDE